MSSQVIGIGTGTILLFSIWIITFILCSIAVRTKKIIGLISIILSSLITLILIFIPISSEELIPREEKSSDYHFIWRNLLVLFLVICSVGTTILLVVTEHCTTPVYPVNVRNWLV